MYVKRDMLKKTNSVFLGTFLWMFFGLLTTAITAVFLQTHGFVNSVLSNSLLFKIILFAQLILMFVFSFAFKKLNTSAITSMFFAYSVMNGVTISIVLSIYRISSILSVLSGTTGLFLLLAVYGYLTKKDISSWHSIFFVGLIAVIISSFINIFLKSTGFEILISAISLLIFCGFTIYDIDRIKQTELFNTLKNENIARARIYFAMSLYLDFIGIFLNLLSITGKKK
ncbi:MAG: Bax inhibitor-1/YccA family protein [Oscillospiraceae bacterium]|jgi:FtsH-binding integral membrane protein|nr:Bax inhibitor-1/YccA family protein [Oscillospiraceae bacterium]